MKPRLLVEEVVLHADARGLVYEPVSLDQLATQRNAHVVLTVPGGIRGNHYHQRGTEIAVIHGPALVRLREDQTRRDLQVPAGKALRLVIPPGVAHAFQNTGNEPMLLVAFNREVFDAAHPDLVREVLIPGP